MFENRIKHLEEAHSTLDRELVKLEAYPSPAGAYVNMRIADIKKMKLKLKDDIEGLRKRAIMEDNTVVISKQI